VVTTGEIGVIKKDIVYSGDVMNTTSRIQAVCNKFRVNILMSKYLLDQMRLPSDLYPLKRVGVIELKGKREKVELFTFEYSILPRPETDPFAFT
jgi:adenylate cyclase